MCQWIVEKGSSDDSCSLLHNNILDPRLFRSRPSQHLGYVDPLIGVDVRQRFREDELVQSACIGHISAQIVAHRIVLLG